MVLSEITLWACGISACFLIGFGIVGLSVAIRAERQRRAFAQYRAASLVVTERQRLRAAQHRAAEREWGRAA